MHTKIFLTGVIAFSTLSASLAEGNFGPAWVEGHNYKVVDGQLVDLGPSATPTPTPSPTPTPAPSPTPLQTPQINITVSPTFQNQEVAVTPPAPAPTLQPAPAPATLQSTAVPSSNPWDFIVGVERDLNDHNWRDLAPYLVDGHINYFGHRYATLQYVAHDMKNDSLQYPSSQSTYYPDTFTHEISNEYSPHWTGPMLYDSINVYSVVTERNGRIHRALTRLTVGYTLNNGVLGIYALVMKVLPGNS
jgi:hypothetical protein